MIFRRILKQYYYKIKIYFSRLLKEKQDNEERAKSATPPILSPSSSSIKSPPPIPEDPAEPMGAGLPLLQRILMLKAKEGTLKEDKPKLIRTSSVRSNPSSPPHSQVVTSASRASFSVTSKTQSAKLSFRYVNYIVSPLILTHFFTILAKDLSFIQILQKIQ